MASNPQDSGASAGERRELPLICFTLLSPASVGVVCGAVAMGKAMDVWLALVALVLVSIGMAGSILHLARPLLAPTSLRNVASSCLSREIVVVSAYWAVVFAWCACCLFAPAFPLVRIFSHVGPPSPDLALAHDTFFRHPYAASPPAIFMI